ncbi:type II toxin-antitoxin system prevent-host-death family antitoxin [Streptomyces sp. NPDC001340]
MTICASEARRDLFPLIKRVNDDHVPVRLDPAGWEDFLFRLGSGPNH